jgi:amino acid transporter
MIHEGPVEAQRLRALRLAGEGWDRDEVVEGRNAGVSADLMVRSVRAGSLPGNRYVRVKRAGGASFRGAGPGSVRATAAVPRAMGPIGRLGYGIKSFVVGNPLANEMAHHERLTKIKALAVLSSDAISSVAYATGAMLSVLLAAGTANFGVSIWIGLAIALLFAMVVLSYRQTIKAYPRGGGSYIVASDNLGSLPGLIAGSSLMIDYVLTVAVSVVSGVAALSSMAPALSPYGVLIDLIFIIVILFGNLRGIRESGTLFMLPSYLFIVGVYAMIVAGIIKFMGNGAHVHSPVTVVHATEALTVFLILRAFASGCTALTGIEAISDGVPAFQPPEWRNARTTITTLGLLAISMFLGITLLVHAFGLVPNPGDSDPTLISMLNRTTLGNGIGFYYVQITTALILMLAANTAFSDFPRLAYFMARDGFLPHQFSHKGDRLSYSNGILVLALLATILILVFQGSFAALVNLYVIGVFASFTLSQSGMVKRWWTKREEGWRKGLLLNGSGAVLTCIVLGITAFTKFIYGAWLVVLLVPILVTVFFRIRAHYQHSARALLPTAPVLPHSLHHTLVVSGFAGNEALAGLLRYLQTLRASHIIVVLPPHAPPLVIGDDLTDLPLKTVVARHSGERAAVLEAVQGLGPRVPGQVVTTILSAPGNTPLALLQRWLLHRNLMRRFGAAVLQIAAGGPGLQSAERQTTLVSVSRLNQAGLEALAYTVSLMCCRVLAVHVAAEEDLNEARRDWEAWGNHVPLVTIDSPYRAIVGPLRAYVDALAEREGGETVTIVLPIVLTRGLLGRLLHNHTANRVRRLLLNRPNTVVISHPHQLA